MIIPNLRLVFKLIDINFIRSIRILFLSIFVPIIGKNFKNGEKYSPNILV